MAAAVGRVQAQAGTLSTQVQGLQRDSAGLVDELRRVDSQARAAAETLQRYRREVAAGKTLSEQEMGYIPGLKDIIVARGGIQGQAFVSQFERELGGGVPRRPAPMAAPMGRMPAAPPPAEHGPRGLTPQEKAEYLRRGGYTPEQLDRARMLKPGTIMVPRPAPRPSVDPPGPDPSGGGPSRPGPQPAGGGTAVPAASAEERAAIAEHNEALQRREAAQRAAALTERGLRVEWQSTTRELREQSRELDRTEASYRKLQGMARQGGRLSAQAREQLDELPAKLADQRAGHRALRVEREMLAAEAQRRGYEVYGDRLFAPGHGRPGAGQAFLGGLGGGFGGAAGGVLGGAAGLLAGTMTPAGLAASMGVAIGAFAARSAETAEQHQRQVFDTGMMMGGGFGNLRASATAGLRGPLRLTFAESLGASRAYAMQTGRSDVRGVAAFARAYGLPVESAAQLLGQMGALGVLPGERTTTHTALERTANPAYAAALQLRERRLSGADVTTAADATGDPSARGAPEGGLTGMQSAVGWLRNAGILNQTGARSRRLAEIAEFRRRLAGTTDPAARAYIEAQLRSRGAMLEGDLMPLPARTLERSVTRTDTSGGLPGILAGAYRASPYRGSARMSAFLQQAGRLMQIQGAGGAPIDDFSRMPTMLSAATRAFGADVAPQFGAELVGGLASGVTQPQGAMQRGIAIRSIMQMGRRTNQTFELPGVGRIDPTSYTGATALMQNAFALPREQSQEVLRAIAGGYRGVVGKGTEASKMFFTQMFGGKAALGLTGERLFEQLLEAKPGADGGDLTGQFKKLFDQAGAEGKPFDLDARVTDAQLAIGDPLKRLSQSIFESVLDFTEKLRMAEATWDSGQAMTPAAQMSVPR